MLASWRSPLTIVDWYDDGDGFCSLNQIFFIQKKHILQHHQITLQRYISSAHDV